jgi:hypothetical protein
VLDISRSGVRLQLQRRFEPGVILGMSVPDGRAEARATLLLRVCWVRAVGDRWQVGGAFARSLSEADLELMAENQPVTVVVRADARADG